MYRKAEYEILNLLSILAVASVIGSLAGALMFFIRHQDPFRWLALILFVLSIFFELQVTMYKMSVMEKRMLHLTGVSEQHFRISKKRVNVNLVLFFILDWIALIAVILVFVWHPGL